MGDCIVCDVWHRSKHPDAIREQFARESRRQRCGGCGEPVDKCAPGCAGEKPAPQPDQQLSDWKEAMEWARDHLQTAMARNKKYNVETHEGIYEAETELRKFLEQLDDKGERDEI